MTMIAYCEKFIINEDLLTGTAFITLLQLIIIVINNNNNN